VATESESGGRIRRARGRTITDPDTIQATLSTMWSLYRPGRRVQTPGAMPPDILGGPATPLSRHGDPLPADMNNPYWSIALLLPTSGTDRGRPELSTFFGQPDCLPVTRDDLTYTYSFAVPSPRDIDFLVAQLDGRAVIELGAGTGYWAWQLSQRNVDVLAYDSFHWADNQLISGIQYHPVHRGSVEKIAEHADRVLMLCWPDYDTPFARQALEAYSGDEVIYIGEGWGGCTGDDAFGEMLAEKWEHVASSPGHVNYYGIHSDVGVYRRAQR
jgi:hypothetical protein